MLGKGDGVWHEPDVPEEADARKRLDAWLKALRIMMFSLVVLLCFGTNSDVFFSHKITQMQKCFEQKRIGKRSRGETTILTTIFGRRRRKKTRLVDEKGRRREKAGKMMVLY
jgi:hypothetical protein